MSGAIEWPGIQRRGQDKSETQEADASQRGPLPVIPVPRGGSAIPGISETFSVSAITGTASTSVPIPISSSRSGFGPQMALSYDSGAGNGPFGFGWQLSLPSVARKTSKWLPRYRDEDESDVFILTGAVELAPLLRPTTDGQ